MYRIQIGLCVAFSLAVAWAQPNRGYYRFPSVHGNQVLFTAEGDLWQVGIEGGVEEVNGTLEVFAWIIVLSKQTSSRSRTATFYLPDEVSQLVHQGLELGDADDRVFGKSNSKQSNGSVGLLTGDAVTRLNYYEQAVTLALIPFKNPQLTFVDPHSTP